MSIELTNSEMGTSTSGVLRSLPRPLHEDEAALVAALLDMSTEGSALKAGLADALVQPMADGDMGSLLFTSTHLPRTAREIAVAQAVDEDGIPIELALNIDQDGALYELDIWKVDFSPLHRLPTPGELRKG